MQYIKILNLLIANIQTMFLISSGDHIYKMDYDKMLDFHKEKNAEATIAVIEVPMEEAGQIWNNEY